MTNRLQRLADQINDLPNQDALRQKKTQLTTIADRAEIALDEVRDTSRRVVALRAVVEPPKELADTIDKQLSIIKRRVQSLSSLILGATVPDAASVSAPLQAVKDAARVMRDAVEGQWFAASNAELEIAKAFVSLAATYDAVFARNLQSALDRFAKSVKSPPTTAAALVEYRESRDALIATRGAMRISGPVAAFLLASLQGRGDAKAILDESVRAFLDQHPALWQKLQVSLA